MLSDLSSLTSKSFPELRHSLPIVQRETTNGPKNTPPSTQKERFVANCYPGWIKSL